MKKLYIENLYETLFLEVKKEFSLGKNDLGFYIPAGQHSVRKLKIRSGRQKKIDRFMKIYSKTLKLSGWLK